MTEPEHMKIIAHLCEVQTVLCYYIILGHFIVNSARTVTKLQATGPTNMDSISGRERKFFCSAESPATGAILYPTEWVPRTPRVK